MAHPEFLYPVMALVLLTFIVMALMLKERVQEMQERRIHPQSAPSSSQLSTVLKNTKAADNYKNLFEFPVLFYVLLRYWHSFVHVGYNKVMTRFKIFLASSAALLAMWTLAVWSLAGN